MNRNLGLKSNPPKCMKKGQARSRIDHKNGGSSGISLFTAIYISQVISGLIWTYLDLSGLDWSGLDWTGVFTRSKQISNLPKFIVNECN